MTDTPPPRRKLSRFRPATIGLSASTASILIFGFAIFIMTDPMANFINGVDYTRPGHKSANFTIFFIQVATLLGISIISIPYAYRLGALIYQSAAFWLHVIVTALCLKYALDPKWSTYQLILSVLPISTIVALYLTQKPANIISTVIITMVVSIFLSIFFAIVLPRYGRMGYDFNGDAGGAHQAWRGIYYQKNFLGHLAGVALVCLACFGPAYIKNRLLLAAGCIGTFLCLVFAKSAGGILIAVVLFLLYFMVLRQKGVLRGIGIFFVVFGSAMFVLLEDALSKTILNLLGKDETFTGRVQIWQYVEDYANRRPLTGLGYNYTASPSMNQDLFSHLNILSVHSAYLDTLINTGWIGTAIWALVVLTAIIGAWRLNLSGQDAALRDMCTLLIVGSLVSGLSEALITQPVGPQPVLFLVGIFGLYRISIPDFDAARTRVKPQARKRRLPNANTPPAG